MKNSNNAIVVVVEEEEQEQDNLSPLCVFMFFSWEKNGVFEKIK